MSNTEGIARNTAVLASARIIERAGGLVVALLISRELGAAGLGIYATAMAYYSLIAVAGAAGSTPLLIREIAKAPEKTSDYVIHASVVAGALSALIALAAWMIVPILGYSHELQLSLMLIMLATVPGTLNTIQEAAFVAHQRVSLEAIMTLISSTALVVATAYLLSTGHGVVSVLTAFVILEYLVTVCYFVLINRYVGKLHLRFKRSFAWQLILEIKTFAAMSLLAAVMARPEVLTSLVTTEVNVGLYSAAIKLVDMWTFIPEVYMTNVFPVLSRAFHSVDGSPQRIQDRSLTHLASFSFPVTVGIFVAAGPIVELFYGPGFGGSVVLLRTLAISVTAISVWAVLWRVLAAAGRQSAVLRAQVITTVVRLSAGTLLILWLDSLGAALAAAGSVILVTTLVGLTMRREGMPVRLVTLSWRYAVASAAMGVTVAACVETHVPLLALTIPAGITYVAGLALLGVVSMADITQPRGWAARPNWMHRR